MKMGFYLQFSRCINIVLGCIFMNKNSNVRSQGLLDFLFVPLLPYHHEDNIEYYLFKI